MKRTFLLCISFICLIVFMCVGVVAGEAVFSLSPSVYEQCFSSPSDCAITYADSYATVTSNNGPGTTEISNGDVYAKVVPTPFDGDAFPWIKLIIKNRSAADVFEFHFASAATGDSLTASTCTHFPIKTNDSDFQEYIFNIKEYNLSSQNINSDVKLDKSVWSGLISTVRFDFMWVAEPSGQVPNGYEMDVRYIGFFASEEEAKAHVFEESSSNSNVVGWDDTFTWILDNDVDVAAFVPASAEVNIEGGALKIIPTGSDPMVILDIPEDRGLLNSDEYRYMAIRTKTRSDISGGAVFITTDKNTSFSGKGYSSYNLNNDGKWQQIIIDMKTGNNFWSDGAIVKQIRIDPINGEDLDADVYLERVGFFKDSHEALNFVSEEIPEFGITYFYGNTYKTIVPANVLTYGYNKADYLLAVDAVPEGFSSDNLPVVFYTDGNGESTVVPLCYTTSAGRTTYVAAKPGKYTVGFNSKEYTDISGHWGEEYIDFVSSRTLFGGTAPDEFSPELAMTRGMFITVLGRMHGLDTAKYDGNTGYSDVPSTEYYAPYIQWAKETGIMLPLNEAVFGAEQPITREDMAVAIANYVNYYKYKFSSNAEPADFIDINELSSESIEAIKAVQKAGIINGKGEGRFDPAGASTRAEVATVMQRVIKGIVGASSYSANYAPDYFTRDRIRLGVWNYHPSFFATDEQFKILLEMGADTVISSSGSFNPSTREKLLSLADKYGVEAYLEYHEKAANDLMNPDDEYITASDVDPIAITADYYEHPSFGGNYIVDEPGSDDYDRLAEICNEYDKVLPEKRNFINLLPMYANDAQLKYGAGASAVEYYDSMGDAYKKYCEEFCSKFDSDVLCVDIYPLFWNGNTKTTYDRYIESINQVASAARKYGKDFWCLIQSYDWSEDDSKRDPSEEEFRWQSYSLLSFGCKSIILWTYLSGNKATPAIISRETFEPTKNYYNVQPVFQELKKLSDTFIRYENLGAFTVNYSNSVPYLYMSDEYKNFDIISGIECNDPLLIGCFEEKNGEGHAFTVVNMVDFAQAKGTELKFKLSQNGKKVTLYNKGEPTVLIPSDGKYAISLEEGQGVFVTIE